MSSKKPKEEIWVWRGELEINGKPMPPHPVRRVEVIQAVVTHALWGDGKEEMVREVVQVWTTDGRLIAENDPLRGATITTASTD